MCQNFLPIHRATPPIKRVHTTLGLWPGAEKSRKAMVYGEIRAFPTSNVVRTCIGFFRGLNVATSVIISSTYVN